jgi:transcriptional regulator with XRE-family HTH domain
LTTPKKIAMSRKTQINFSDSLPQVKPQGGQPKLAKEMLLGEAQLVLKRLEEDRLTRVPLLYLGELPSISGVYFAATADGQTLYIGKATNFTQRCKISTHHKLSTAIEKGAVFLFVANVPANQAWHVEQWLIDQISPPLNQSCCRWWLGSESSLAQLRKKATRTQLRKKATRSNLNSKLDNRILAKARFLRGESLSAISASLGTSTRTLERWSSAERWSTTLRVVLYFKRVIDCEDCPANIRSDALRLLEESIFDKIVRNHNRANHLNSKLDNRVLAKARFLRGESLLAIAASLGTSTRTLERWSSADKPTWGELRELAQVQVETFLKATLRVVLYFKRVIDCEDCPADIRSDALELALKLLEESDKIVRNHNRANHLGITECFTRDILKLDRPACSAA